MLTKIIVIKLILIIIMIIFEYKNLKSVFFWFVIILFIPFGFIFYIVFGNGLKFKAKYDILKYKKNTKNYLKKCSWYKYYKSKENDIDKNKLSLWLKKRYNIDLWHNNKIKIIYESEKFLQDLLNNLSSAKNYILLEFYIFADDKTGKIISQKLKEMASCGVRVIVIYDAIGSRKSSDLFWKNLQESGVEVFPYFPSFFNMGTINFKINYRNHRKIVVIDGRVSYIGGVNIRDDHMGHHRQLKPWQDTMLKLEGNATYSIINVFMNDYVYLSKNAISLKDINLFFPKPCKRTGVGVNIISSGPESNLKQIKNFYIKAIKSASNYLYIQTPYFVVDYDIIKMLLSAKKRGVDIKIFLPKKPDKKIVYAASIKCVKPLINAGIEIYLCNGFLHSKTLTCEKCISVGSCNFDNRSFDLNFEITGIIYDKKQIQAFKRKIDKDISISVLLDQKKYEKIEKKYFIPFILYKLLVRLL